MRPRGKMRIYGCGGAGTNIASKFLTPSNEPNFAEIHPVFVDTSRSNMRPEIQPEQTYLLDNLDGSGKVRADNYEAILNVIKPVLHQHKPMDFNVVIFSGSGGSGSVIGPAIVSELLERGLTVVCIVVGSDESKIAASNTIKTLKTLEGVSKKTGKPVVMLYRHNARRRPRTEVDSDLEFAVLMFAALASRQVPELDTADVRNFLQFDKTTPIKPSLAAIEIFDRTDGPWGDYLPISVASISASPDEEPIPVRPEYHCGGHIDLGLPGVKNVHYLIDVNVVGKFAQELNKTISELEEAHRARPVVSSIISNSDKVDDNGFVV